MSLKRLAVFCHKCVFNKRSIHISSIHLKEKENPIRRTFRILKDDIVSMTKPREERLFNLENLFPSHVDIVIIGGGAIGSSIAYFLKDKTGLKGLRIVVIDRDMTYAKSSSTLSVGGLRQQFSLPENIQMSLFGAEFLRSLKTKYGNDGDVFFTPNGYLMLSTEHGAQQLMDNSKLQKELGAVNVILSKDALKKRFPWMNVTDVEMGCLGLEKEGWFDPWTFLHIMKRGAIEMGTRYLQAEAVGFTYKDRRDVYTDGISGQSYQGLDELLIKLPEGEVKSIKFAFCIIAAGADSGEVGKMAQIGNGPSILTIPIPVTKRKRYVYCFDCQDEPPGLNAPMTIDYTGAYFRRDGLGGSFIAGLSPHPEDEPDTSNLEVDHTFFDDKLWPLLANRVPVFNSIKVRSSWSGFYDFNSFDENGIIGPHPYYYNLYMATGFSGHGIQQAPAVGRAIAELIIDGQFQTIDLTRLGFDRLIVNKPIYEVCIV